MQEIFYFLRAENLGQRAFVGKVNMDMKAPDSYRETTEESLAETARYYRTFAVSSK